jgi:hypothetical protein
LKSKITKASDGVTLFDRLALAVAGAVIGYPTGLVLGWALFFLFGQLFGPSLTAGKVFFYYLPMLITAISIAGFVIFPKSIGVLLAKLWRIALALSRR